MKFAAVLSLIIGSAAAFAPSTSSNTKAASALQASAEGLPGALAPVGFFDPLGLAEKATDAYHVRQNLLMDV